MSAIRLHLDDLYADIIPDRRDSRLWFYVVQREDSPEVLDMGNCASEESARALGREAMRRIATDSSSMAA